VVGFCRGCNFTARLKCLDWGVLVLILITLALTSFSSARLGATITCQMCLKGGEGGGGEGGPLRRIPGQQSWPATDERFQSEFWYLFELMLKSNADADNDG